MAKKSSVKKTVIKHLKEDIKGYAHEASEDRDLIKKLKGPRKKKASAPKKRSSKKASKKARNKIEKVMLKKGKS